MFRKIYIIFHILITLMTLSAPHYCGAESFALSVDEVEYYSGSEQLYTIAQKAIYAMVYVNNASDKSINMSVINAVYGENGLSDIEISKEVVPPNSDRVKIKSDSVIVSKDDKLCKTFIWENDKKEIIKGAQLSDKSCEKKITSLSVNVGGNEFIGYVNNETKKIAVYVPTQYAYAAFSDVTDDVAKSFTGCATPAALKVAQNGGAVPKLEGVGKIAKLGKIENGLSYKVTAQDGSSVDYDIKFISTKVRMQHFLDKTNTKLGSNGFPNSNNRLGGGGWGWVDSSNVSGYTTSVTQNPTAFRVKKSSKDERKGFYTCSSFQYSVFGFAKTAIVDIDLKIAELGDGAGLSLSYFSTEQDENKNANLIFKKVAGKNEAELFWSSGGTRNPVKIKGAENVSLNRFHNVRVVREMNDNKTEEGTYKGVVDVYIDYKHIGSFVNTNYITFNGETPSSPSVKHNAAYCHVAFCAADEGEVNGTTFTVDISKIDVQAQMYKDRVRSEGLMKSLKKFDERFDMDFLTWLASLYDKESGGFYASASARDYPGFYADIESSASAVDTIQRLNLWDSEAVNSGMIPQEFIDGLVNFAIDRQNPDDGYFYDPQWGYDLNNTKKDRSLYQALGLIELKEGATPKYKTPGERLEGLASLSEALLMADEDRFASEQNCRAWLDGLWQNCATKYEATSNIASSWSLVVAAEYEEVVRDFLREKQNPETGLFGEGLTTDALNAAMKAGCAFDTPKSPYPRYEKALESITVIISQNKPANAPEVWNPLSSIERIIYSNSMNLTIEEYEKLDASIEGVYEVIYGYFSEYFQADHGASTYRESSIVTGSDATAVNLSIGAREGDIEGSNMLLRTKNAAYSVAGVAEPKLFTKEQKKQFWDMIKNAKPVQKKAESELWYSLDDNFEGYGNVELLDKWRIIQRKDTKVYVTDKQIGSGSASNKVLRFHCGVDGGNTYLSRHCFTPDKYNRVVEEFDIFIDSNGAYFNAGVGTGHKEMFSAFQYIIDARNKKKAEIYTITGTGGNHIMTLDLDRWYKFKIVYTADAKSDVVKFYVDGTLKYSGNDYYNMGREGRAPTKTVDGVSFTKYHASTGSIYVDNLKYYYE